MTAVELYEYGKIIVKAGIKTRRAKINAERAELGLPPMRTWFVCLFIRLL